jgi:hypothetical protein
MKLGYSGWLKRSWPLALCVIGTLGIVHLLPQMYWDFEFSRHGTPVPAHYIDLSQDDDFFRYAYAVGDVTYEGKASWNDADSNIYSHKAGDQFQGVEYLSTKPWLSIYRRNPAWELRSAKIWIVCDLSIVSFGFLLYWFRLRKHKHLAV